MELPRCRTLHGALERIASAAWKPRSAAVLLGIAPPLTVARTRATSAAGRELQDGRIYGTEVFSTCKTECHPGWYLWPTIEESRNYTQGPGPYVKVKARIIDIHKAGTKWRSRAIWVIGEVKNA